MNQHQPVLAQTPELALATNRVLRNTYSLLSMTLLFSAVTAGISLALQMPPMTYLICIAAALVLVWFVLPKVAHSATGLLVVFAFTGLMGFGLGPVLSLYLSLANGPQIIMTALAGTGIIFLSLSGYVLVSRRSFSFLGGFLFVGIVLVLVAAIANIFLHIPALSLTISAIAILIFSGFILYDTSRIIHGGETNYLYATVALYLDIFNIFIHLLHILGIFGGDD